MRFDLGTLFVSFDPRVDVGVKGNEEPIGLILVKDFDPLGIVIVVEEIDILFDQFHGGLIDSAMQGDRSVTVHFTSGTGAEEIGEILGRGSE